MFKLKHRKYKKRSFFSKNKEIVGSILMLIGVIGIGAGLTTEHFGVIGKFISGMSMFLTGAMYFFNFIAIFLYGLYIIVTRDKFKFFNIKLVGLYVFIIGTLSLIHINYVNLNAIELNIFDATKVCYEQMLDAIKGTFNPAGGGVIGAYTTILFVKLLSSIGAKIVSIVLITIGAGLVLNFSIIDLIKYIIKKVRDIKFNKKIKEIVKDDTKELEHKKIISNFNELSNVEKKSDSVDVEVDRYKATKNGNYILPNYKLLLDQKVKNNVNESKQNIKYNVERLEKVLEDFDVIAKVVGVNVGPAVTLYEMELKSGTKISKVLGISREISLALAAKNVRIQAPIPGKNTIGIELPNAQNTIVTLRDVFEDIPTAMNNSKLCVALGKNIMGKTIYMEINNTPHLLVAGATGSGKSCCINSIIISILLRTTPDEVKLVLIDPKKVEMSIYNGIPHLLMPVVTDPRKASLALGRMVSEMERRYSLFNETNTKNISDYNEHVNERNKNMNGDLEKLPYIVIIIDELADLMLIAAKEVEDSILRITQMARAAGIHLIVATQRPSVDVITGLVKANIPSRISFAVSSSVDSRTILDMLGAEKLLGKGDMLFLPMGENTPIRIQGAYVKDSEIKKVVDYTVSQQKAQFDDRYTLVEAESTMMHKDDEDEYEDPLYNEIVEFVIKTQKASASLLQRRYKLGYNRAARIVDLLEERGIVGPQNGSKPREVLVELDESNKN